MYMHFHFQQFLRAVILAAFALFFIKLHYTGDITKYINPKYELMSQIAAGIFGFLFLIQLFRIWESDHNHDEHCPPGCGHDHGYSGSISKRLINYSIIIFPLLTGFTLSPAVLDSSIAAKKGTLLPQGNREAKTEEPEELGGKSQYSSISENSDIQDDEAPLPNNNVITEKEYDQKMEKLFHLDVIELKESMFQAYYETINLDPKAFIGKKIKLSGFVYKEEGFTPDQLVISRFSITHCIADASIIGFLSEFTQASEFKQDTWVEVEGTLDVTTYNGVELPFIKVEKLEAIKEPAEPYIYPVITKITE